MRVRHALSIRPLSLLVVAATSTALLGGIALAGINDADAARGAFALLEEPFDDADALDARAEPVGRLLVAASSRLLYQSQTERYWISLASNDDVCLTALLTVDEAEWAAATGCGPLHLVLSQALTLSVTSASAVLDASLVADDVLTPANRSMLADSGVTVAGNNLVVFSPGKRPYDLAIQSNAGAIINLGSSASTR
jgi:hypothetical protein